MANARELFNSTLLRCCLGLALLGTQAGWALPRCQMPPPRAHACGTMVCDETNKVWVEQARPGGESCNRGQGRCDGVDVNCQCLSAPNAHTGLLLPRFLVVGLIYAPPGCSGTGFPSCPIRSSVLYQFGSTLQTTMSMSGSFASDVKESVSLGANIAAVIEDTGAGPPKSLLDATFGFGQNSEFTSTQEDSQSVQVGKANTVGFGANGGNDGIDHNADTFLLLMNPAVIVTQQLQDTGHDACSLAPELTWTPGLSNLGPTHSAQSEDIQAINVGRLLNPTLMSPHEAKVFKDAGVTAEDIQALLALDPFASGSTSVDGQRFIPTIFSFGYDPPGDNVCTDVLQTLTNTYQALGSDTTTTSYSIGFTESQGLVEHIGLSVFSFSHQTDKKTTITNRVSQSTQLQSSESASFVLGCPSASFPGMTVQVFWDSLFSSFMFAPPAASANLHQIHTGRLLQADGQAAPRVPVQLKYRGKTYRTTTRRDGSYEVYSTDVPHPGLRAILTAVGITKVVPVAQPAPTITRTRNAGATR